MRIRVLCDSLYSILDSAVETPALFSGTVDRYKGVTVISSEVDHSGVDIEAKLKG